MTIQQQMGLRIKELRTKNKLTQTELALKVGYKDKTAIAKIEAGQIDLSQSKIYAFAKALNSPIEYLFSCGYSNSSNANQTEEKINELLSKMDADDQSETLRYIEFKLASDKYKAKGSLLHA